MRLIPCPDCARHVDADGARCPFCAARVRAARPRPRIVGPVTRAVIFYAGTLAACAEPAAEAPPAPAAVTAPMEPVDAIPEPPAAEPPPILAQEVRVELEPEPAARALAERRHAEGQKHPRPRVIQRVIDPWNSACCPPYGAPAFDFELV